MPLTIEAPPEEHPDVVALKKKVVEVASKYTTRHGWCNEVNSALEEIGVKPKRASSLRVDVTFRVPFVEGAQTTTISVNPTELAGKTDEEMNAFVADMLAPSLNVGVTAIKIPVIVDDLNVATGPAVNTTNSGLVVPDGYVYYYTSGEGRVAHLFAPGATFLGEVQRRGDAGPGMETALLRALRDHRRNLYPACGANVTYAQITRTSERSENRVCQRCYDHAVRNPITR